MEGQFKILIVDDSPANIDMLSGALSDFKQMIALNGEKALHLAESKLPPDLILLDIMMPGMDGYEVCKRLKSNDVTKDIPVIFLTAKTEEIDIVKGFKSGGQDYITKPFKPEELHARVKTHLELKASREKLKSVNEWLEKEVNQRTEDLNKALRKLEEANRQLIKLDKAKGDFLNMISQNIRNPLNSILGIIHILKNKADSKDLIDLVVYLDNTVESLEKFSSMTIEITELRSSLGEIRKEEIPFKQFLEFCLLEVSELLSDNKIRMDVSEIPSDIKVSGNEELMMKCLTAILNSSMEVWKEGSELAVKLSDREAKHVLEFIDDSQQYNQADVDKLHSLLIYDENRDLPEPNFTSELIDLILKKHDSSLEVAITDKSALSIRILF